MTPEQVWKAFSRHTATITNARTRAVSTPSERTLEQAAQFLSWCAAQRIHDPDLYIRWRIEGAHAARYRLPLRALVSDKMADHWRRWGAEKFGARLEQEKLRRQMPAADRMRIQSLRVLVPAMETYQFHHVSVGRADVCMETPEYSGGFHPRSRVCPTCPKAIACANRLVEQHGFDVPALRAEEFHKLPAVIIAAAIS